MTNEISQRYVYQIKCCGSLCLCLCLGLSLGVLNRSRENKFKVDCRQPCSLRRFRAVDVIRVLLSRVR